MAVPQVVFRKEVHRNQLVLSIYVPNAEPFNSIVRKLNATYSVTKKMWWLAWDKGTVNTAYKAFKGTAWVDYSALQAKEKGRSDNSVISEYANGSTASTVVANSDSPPAPLLPERGAHRTGQAKKAETKWTQAQKDAMWAYADKLRIRKYSESTFKTYGVYFKQFLAAHPNVEPKDITEEQIIAFVLRTVKEHSYATKTQNQIQPVGFAP